MEDADKYPVDWMNGYELHDLQDSCTYAMNEYARKETERRQWSKWLNQEEILVREEHNRKLATLKAEFNEKLEDIQERKHKQKHLTDKYSHN